MSWQIFIFISLILNAVATLLQRVILIDKGSHPKAYAVFFQVFTGLLIGAFGFLTVDMSYSGAIDVVPNLLLMTALYGFGNVFVFKALKMLEASEFSIIFATKALFTILASTFFLQEGLSVKQIFGSFLLFLGVIIVNIEPAKKISFSKNEGLGLLAAVLFGLAITNDRIIVSTLDLYPFLFIAFVAPGLFIALVNPKVVGKMRVFLNKKILSKILVLSTVYALAAISFYSGLKLAPNTSQVASFNLTGIIITVLLAIIFLKERKNLVQKLVATIVSFIGLVLVN